MITNNDNPVDYHLIGSRIREARQEAGFTQAELGELLGITQGMVNKLETAKTAITLESVFKLSEVLNRPVIYFLGVGTDSLTDDEVELLEFFRLLPKGMPRTIALDMIKALVQRAKETGDGN